MCLRIVVDSSTKDETKKKKIEQLNSTALQDFVLLYSNEFAFLQSLFLLLLEPFLTQVYRKTFQTSPFL